MIMKRYRIPLFLLRRRARKESKEKCKEKEKYRMTQATELFLSFTRIWYTGTPHSIQIHVQESTNRSEAV